MEICLIFMLSNGFAMGTAPCQNQLFFGDGLVEPHEVVYLEPHDVAHNSHPDACWEGYLFYIPAERIFFKPFTRQVRYHTVYRRHINRIKYHGKVYRPKHYKRYKRYKRPRTKHHRYKRLVKPRRAIRNKKVINRRHYKNPGKGKKMKKRGRKGKGKKY